MTRHLLPQRERYFKTALHVHTDVSDGFWTPEELKACFKEHGFSCVAFSDHNLITDQSHLNDEDFLTLTSYEMGFSEKGGLRYHDKGIHINVLSKEAGNLWQAANPEKLYKRSPEFIDKAEIVDWDCDISMESINKFIADSNAHGFLCTYNHPDCNMFYDNEDMNLTGFWGLEVFNNDGYLCGNPCYNDEKYQRYLMKGERIFPIISDDCHSKKSFRGYGLWVGAESLTYESMIQALEKGDFYSTNGPEIYSLTLEDKTLHVTCSDAVHIALLTQGNLRAMRPPHEQGIPVNEAKFDLTPWFDSINEEWKDRSFFRLVITGPTGKRAYTRPYWLDEL